MTAEEKIPLGAPLTLRVQTEPLPSHGVHEAAELDPGANGAHLPVAQEGPWHQFPLAPDATPALAVELLVHMNQYTVARLGLTKDGRMQLEVQRGGPLGMSAVEQLLGQHLGDEVLRAKVREWADPAISHIVDGVIAGTLRG